jgi:adenylate kinase
VSGDGTTVPRAVRRLVLLARPGGGKSTQGELLAGRLGVAHLSTGALLRDEVASGSPLGHQVAPVLEHGDLVADPVVLAIVTRHLEQAVADGGYVLDGFPRDEDQEHAFSGTCPDAVQPQVVVLLDVPADECRRRLLARAPIEGRTDDTAETIDRRLAAFDRDLRPVIEAYRRRGNLVRVDGDADRSVVTERILDRLTCP